MTTIHDLAAHYRRERQRLGVAWIHAVSNLGLVSICRDPSADRVIEARPDRRQETAR